MKTSKVKSLMKGKWLDSYIHILNEQNNNEIPNTISPI